MKTSTKCLLGAVCLSVTLTFGPLAIRLREKPAVAQSARETLAVLAKLSPPHQPRQKQLSLKHREQKPEWSKPAPQSPGQYLPQEIEADKVFSAFDQWIEQYLATTSLTEAAGLEKNGEQLAQARRDALAGLIESDPQRALQMAVPFAKRQKLPPSIQEQLEDRLSGMANYRVLASLPDPNGRPHSASIERYVTLNDRTFKAYVYGRRLTESSKESIPVHGIALGDKMALHESPVRVLEAGEASDPSLPLPANAGLCPVSKSAGLASAAVQVGDEVVYLCHDKHIETFTHDLEAQESELSPLSRQSDSSRSTGLKKVLLMRVNFPDDPAVSISDADANELMRQVNAFYIENSFGSVSITATVTPVLTLPNLKSYYLKGDADYTLRELLAAGRAAAEAIGLRTANFDFDFVHNRICSPRAYVGMRGAMLYDNDVTAASHELGHNLGAWHANGWKTSDGSIIGQGGNLEYANPFDTMGGGRKSHFNAYYKHQLGWLPDSAVQTVSNDGIYRLYPIDLPRIEDGLTYALTIKKDNMRTYWIETRQSLNSAFPGNVLLNWSPWYGSAGGTELLDATPLSHGSFFDAPFMLGQSFYDPDLGVKVLPWNATSDYVEVLVKHVHYLAFEAESSIPTLEASSASLNASVLLSADDPAATPFLVEVPADGEYRLSFRVEAGAGAKSLAVSVDNAADATIDLASAASDARWVRMGRGVGLSSGKHVIHMRSSGGEVEIGGIVLTDDPTEQLPPPMIAKVSDHAIALGTPSISIPLRIMDMASSGAPVQLTATSSNSGLLLGSAIALSGSGENWTATLTPRPGKTGQTVITVTIARPGGYSTATSFALTISNAAPPPRAPGADLLTTRVEQSGDITIILSKPSRSNWTIQATEDFVHWQDLVDLTATSAATEFTDSSAHNFARRFYRAVAN